jgi:hypothetical protein
MDAIADTATTVLAPKILKNFKFSWLVYGVAAYYGLKFLNKKGIMPKQTSAALDLVDRGVDFAKSQVGFGKSADQPSMST